MEAMADRKQNGIPLMMKLFNDLNGWGKIQY